MSVTSAPDAREEARLIAAYPRHLIKRFAPGETSNWDDRPFRERHTIARTNAVRRYKSESRKCN